MTAAPSPALTVSLSLSLDQLQVLRAGLSALELLLDESHYGDTPLPPTVSAQFPGDPFGHRVSLSELSALDFHLAAQWNGRSPHRVTGVRASHDH